MTTYTPEQLREDAACYEGCEGGLGRERDLMLAHAAKIEECERLKGVLKFWASDGRLQTFPDRERFRAEAHAALKETK